MFGFDAWAILALASSIDTGVVETAASMLARGEDPYTLQSVEVRSDDQSEPPPTLTGCIPVVSKASTRTYIQIDYHCDGAEGVYMHRVFFSPGEKKPVRIFIDPIPTAVGPTSRSIELSDLPSERRQFKNFIDAVRKRDDPSLGGLVPLTTQQKSELSQLSDCRWDSALKSQARGNIWISFVRCDHHEKNRGRMVEAEFDEDGHMLVLLVGYGARTKTIR